MLLQKARYHVRAERETNTSIVFAPAGDVLVGIGPQEIAQEAAVRDLHRSVRTVHDNRIRYSKGCTYIGGTHDAPDLLHRVQIRAQTAVHGENLLVDDSGDRKAVEAVCERLP